MNISEVMTELKAKGSAQTRKTYGRHGAPDNLFGVKVGDMKTIARKIKGQQELAYELFDTGNVDAMYLAGIVADGKKFTKRRLNQWARESHWYMTSEYTVPGVAAESPFAREVARKWIDAKKDNIASCGWATYAGWISITDDGDLDLDEIRELLKRVENEIETASNRTRYTMNGFVIAVGTYVKPLLKAAKATAKKIGKVEVDLGQTACKVPLATDYIAKVEKMNRVGKKRPSAKC